MFGMRIRRVVMIVIVVVVMIMPVVVIVVVVILCLKSAHARAECIAKLAIGHI